MEVIFIGLITAINLIVILKKIKLNRYEDALLDSALFALIVYIFAGSYAGMAVACVASLTISLYLFANPPITFRKVLEDNNISVKGLWKDILNFDISKNPRS